MTDRTCATRPGGFTLLELLIATAMASVLILSCYAAFRVAFKARETALNAVGPARAGEAAMDILRRDIESALPPIGRLASSPTGQLASGSDTAGYGFIGDQGEQIADTSELLFTTIAGPAPGFVDEVTTGAGGGFGGGGSRIGGSGGAPTAANSGNSGFMNNLDTTRAGGIVGVTYLVRTTSGGNRVLVRQLHRNLLPLQVENIDPDEESIVCRNVRTFIVRYYDGEQFQDFWDSTQLNNALPMAVEVTLELDAPPAAPGRPAAAANTISDQRPYYSAVRTFFPACYDAAAAANASGASATTGGTP